jgi:glycosyltransferase involved in cell wall biosynthesis
MKLAYFVLPHIGGTYSVFKHLRSGLADFGIELRWLGLSRGKQAISPDMRGEMLFGNLLHMPETLDERTCARCLAGAIESRGYDGVVFNVLSDRMQTNIARYLPAQILRLMVVHNITPGTYAAAKAIRDHVHATIGVSERCRSDLVSYHGFSPTQTFVIPNGVNAAAFRTLTRAVHRRDSKLRVLFVGRIEDASKGVLWLPAIMDNLQGAIELTIAGDGPDMPKLKGQLKRHAGRISYAGFVHPEKVPALMSEHDILIMPSRFEGLPMTLIEAMAAGCVPVASNIRGVTDTIIDHGEDGMLFPVGNAAKAADLIGALSGNPDLLNKMSGAARNKVADKFAMTEMARRYRDIIRSVEANPPTLAPPLDFDQWTIPPGLRSGLRTYIPLPVKNWLRVARERL